MSEGLAHKNTVEPLCSLSVLTCSYIVSQCHDHFDILRPELVYIFGRLRERRQLGAIENHLAAADFQKDEEENRSNTQRLHSFATRPRLKKGWSWVTWRRITTHATCSTKLCVFGELWEWPLNAFHLLFLLLDIIYCSTTSGNIIV